MLLLSGLGDDASSWEGVAALLKNAGYAVVAAPAPGAGGRPPCAGPKEDIETVMAEAKAVGVLPPYIVVGHSFGALSAIAADQNASKVVLVDPTPFSALAGGPPPSASEDDKKRVEAAAAIAPELKEKVSKPDWQGIIIGALRPDKPRDEANISEYRDTYGADRVRACISSHYVQKDDPLMIVRAITDG